MVPMVSVRDALTGSPAMVFTDDWDFEIYSPRTRQTLNINRLTQACKLYINPYR